MPSDILNEKNWTLDEQTGCWIWKLRSSIRKGALIKTPDSPYSRSVRYILCKERSYNRTAWRSDCHRLCVNPNHILPIPPKSLDSRRSHVSQLRYNRKLIWYVRFHEMSTVFDEVTNQVLYPSFMLPTANIKRLTTKYNCRAGTISDIIDGRLFPDLKPDSYTLDDIPEEYRS